MIIVVDVEVIREPDSLVGQPCPVVHPPCVRFRGVPDHQLRVLKAKVRTIPVPEEIQIVNPGRRLETLRILAGLEVRLAKKRRKVARFAQLMGDRWAIVIGQIRSHMEAPVSRRVLPRQHRAPRGRAHRVHRVCPVEQDALPSQAIQAGRPDGGIPAPNRIRSLLITRNKQDVQIYSDSHPVGCSDPDCGVPPSGRNLQGLPRHPPCSLCPLW